MVTLGDKVAELRTDEELGVLSVIFDIVCRGDSLTWEWITEHIAREPLVVSQVRESAVRRCHIIFADLLILSVNIALSIIHLCVDT